MNLRVGVIGIKGAWSSEIIKTTLESDPNRNISVEIMEISNLVFEVSSSKVFYGKKDLECYDFIVIKKLGKYAPKILEWLDILSVLEARGQRFYSSPQKLKVMISRIGCTRLLAANQIPMPDTIITEDVKLGRDWVVKKKGALFKPNFSTKARGMQIIKASNKVTDKLEDILEDYSLLYLQELLELPGKDYGVVFIGSEYIGTYARVGKKGAWNTTTADGGHYEEHEPSNEILSIAKKAQAVFQLDFCCVDIAETNKGAVVFEVSAFGGFKGMLKGANINMAERLAKYILKDF